MRRVGPLHLLVTTAVIIFTAEGLIMWLFQFGASWFAVLSWQGEALLDASGLTLIASCALYWTLLRPLQVEIARRATTEEALQQAHVALERHAQRQTQELAQASGSLHAVVETASDAIVSADDQGRVVYWNRQARTIFGYSADEIIGESLTLIMPERFRDAHALGLHRVVSGEKARLAGKTSELIGLRKDGTEFPLELSLAQWEAEGKIFFTAILRDITERKQTDGLLKQKVDELKSLNNIMMNREERILEMKREVSALLKELGRPPKHQA